jgi:hypothetical protein
MKMTNFDCYCHPSASRGELIGFRNHDLKEDGTNEIHRQIFEMAFSEKLFPGGEESIIHRDRWRILKEEMRASCRSVQEHCNYELLKLKTA